jgi:tetratricopeptide (TPR) repeat protein
MTCDFAGAVDALETGLAGLDSAREPEETCYSTSFLAMALAHQGQFERSFALHEQALHLARVTGDLTHEAAALVRLEISHVVRGDWQTAIDVGRNVLRIAERIENPMLAGFAMFDEGHAQFMLGDEVAGVARCEEGRRLVEESGSRLGFSLYLSNLAELYAAVTEFDRAADVAERALARRQTGERLGVYAAYRALALVAEHRAPCQPDLAQSRLAYAHRLASAAGAWPAVAVGRLRRAEMCMRQQRPGPAAASAREAVSRFESMRMPWWLDRAKRLQVSLNAASGTP